jgi:outer membrane protein OmpA-like peptidoglycan-associated protein
MVFNEQIKENNGGIANLIVERGSYKSLDGYFGIRFEHITKDLTWHIKVQRGYLLFGNDDKSEVEIRFREYEGTGKAVVRGREDALQNFVIGAGVNKSLNDAVSFFAGADFLRTTSGEITQFKINAGIKRTFERASKNIKLLELLEQALERRDNALQTFRMSGESSFLENTAILSISAIAEIRRIATMMKTGYYMRLTIEEHIDSSDGDKKNIKLLQDRVVAVYRELRKNGFSARRMETINFGDSMPLVPNDTPAGRETNRRIEIFVVSE